MMTATRSTQADSAVAMAYQVLAEGSFSFLRCDFVYLIYWVSSLSFFYPRQRFTYVRQILYSQTIDKTPSVLMRHVYRPSSQRNTWF